MVVELFQEIPKRPLTLIAAQFLELAPDNANVNVPVPATFALPVPALVLHVLLVSVALPSGDRGLVAIVAVAAAIAAVVAITAHDGDDLVFHFAEAVDEEVAGLVLRAAEHVQLPPPILPLHQHVVQLSRALRDLALQLAQLSHRLVNVVVLDVAVALRDAARLFVFLEAMQQRLDGALVRATSFLQVRPHLLGQLERDAHRGVLLDQLLVLGDKLLGGARHRGEVAGHLLVFHDGPLRGDLQLVIRELHEGQVRLLDLQRHLLLQAVLLLHREALKVVDVLLVVALLLEERRGHLVEAREDAHLVFAQLL
mmetsp:Transcript_30422/g.76160  ORF Transcript_30422/g.76160 Transcript_30422/m.76160 type:complete len:311 (+) Transcript_30422:633-1565(+)